MNSIIGGIAGGRRLTVPSSGTRPTSARARGALFNTAGSLINLQGAQVLDLFAGSGAVGLEALSRGAAGAVLVEADRLTCQVIQSNVLAVGLPGARVIRQKAATFLAQQVPSQPYDLIFLDPPYALADQELATLLSTVVTPSWLSESGLIAVERPARAESLSWPASVEAIKHRRYGEAMLWYGRREQISVGAAASRPRERAQ